jgi:RNA polymerase-binding transcription factor DksA
MDRNSIGRFKKVLEARHRNLRVGLAKTQREAQAAEHDQGKDEGDRAAVSLARELDEDTNLGISDLRQQIRSPMEREI